MTIDEGSTPLPQNERSSQDRDIVDIVQRARSGEAAAWEELVRRFSGVVSAVARGCRLNEADVAEVSQTTWLRLVENLDRVEQPARIGAWLATTSRRESIRIARKRTRSIPTSGDILQMPDATLDPIDFGILKEEQVNALRAASEKLPPHCRRLFSVLMGHEDLTYKQISEMLDMPIGSIGPTRGRCLEHLRQLLAEQQSAPGVVNA